MITYYHAAPVPYSEVQQKNAAKGTMNRAAGLRFEGKITAACRYYLRQGAARIEKTPEPVRILSKMNERGQFKACYEKQAQPDYQGTMNGKSVVFEAKYTSTDRVEASRLTKEQKAALEDH